VARSSNQAKNSIPTSQNNLPTVTSEPILPKVSSDSFSDQLQNRNTEGLSLPQGKISEKLHKIDGDGEVANNYYKQETNNSLVNGISKMENHASRSAKVKSKKAYCFRFLRLWKSRGCAGNLFVVNPSPKVKKRCTGNASGLCFHVVYLVT